MSKPIARNTPQKQAIRDAFLEADCPLSPEEALRSAQRGHPHLGIATVYRNIRALLADQWLEPVAVPGEGTRYEVAGKAHHHHFHCRQCGRMYELGTCADTVLPRTPRGFRVEGHELLLYGECGRCSSPSLKRAATPGKRVAPRRSRAAGRS